MGEMNVEHVLLFLVGAFFSISYDGKCRRVEGATTQKDGCKFFGNAPFCDGECPPGWWKESESDTGYYPGRDGMHRGARCLTGKKVNCCPTPRPS